METISKFILFLVVITSCKSFAVEIPNRAQLRMVSCHGDSDISTGIVTIDMKIPGEVGVDKRIIEGGAGWFDTSISGDMFNTVDIMDLDNIVIGGMMAAGLTLEQAQVQALVLYPLYPKVGSFAEDSAEVTMPAHKGWFLPVNQPLVVKSIGGAEELTSGLYLRFIATKKTPSVDTFRVNVYWGE